MQAEWLTPIMKGITALSEVGAIEILLCLALLIWPKTRRLGIICAASLAFTFICCNLIIKPLADRLRPWEVFEDVIRMLPDPGDASFPSGHSASAMGTAWAMFLASRPVRVRKGDSGDAHPVRLNSAGSIRTYDQLPCLGWRGAGADPRVVHRWSIFAVGLALLTAVSRLYLGMHFPLDVLSGVMLGMLCAYIVHIVFKKTEASRGIIGSKGIKKKNGKTES